jgi:hypothetical protein
MANPFPFSSGDVLTAANLNDIGESETWTPTSSNGIVQGNGTFAGTYQRVNDLVVAQGTFTLGSTSSISTFVRFSAPVAAISAAELAMGTKGTFNDASSGVFYPLWGRTYATGETYLYSLAAGATYLSASSNWPIAATTGDIIYVSMTYRVGA